MQLREIQLQWEKLTLLALIHRNKNENDFFINQKSIFKIFQIK